MVYESRYWKEPLLAMAKRLRSYAGRVELSEDECAQLERDVFIGFYSVRKLLDAPMRLTDKTRSLEVKLTIYPNTNQVNWRNKDSLDELYDFAAERTESRDLRFVCGRVIHSFVFSLFVDESGGLVGFVFTSDLDKDKVLYQVSVGEIVSIFERVGSDWPERIRIWVNSDTGREETEIE